MAYFNPYWSLYFRASKRCLFALSSSFKLYRASSRTFGKTKSIHTLLCWL